MPPSTAILDATDARLRAARLATQPDYQVRGATPAALSTQPAPHPAIERMNTDIEAERVAAGERLKARLEAARKPIPYAVRMTPKVPVSDLVAQQQPNQDIRPPEWWAEGLAGGGTALANWLWSFLNGGQGYEERMQHDPVYRELRRSALMARYESELRRAAALAQSGQQGHAQAAYREAERLRSLIRGIDAGQ